MERASRGGEKRTAVWASPHEERGSDGAVAPPMCAHRVVLHRCVVREWCHPSGAAGAPGLHAAARTRRAARAVQGDVVSVWQVLPETPSAPPIPAQRVARFDDHCTRNCLLQNKLRQRYSRSTIPLLLPLSKARAIARRSLAESPVSSRNRPRVSSLPTVCPRAIRAIPALCCPCSTRSNGPPSASRQDHGALSTLWRVIWASMTQGCVRRSMSAAC